MDIEYDTRQDLFNLCMQGQEAEVSVYFTQSTFFGEVAFTFWALYAKKNC